MPTLFTALRSHVEPSKTTRAVRHPVLGVRLLGEPVSGIGRQFAEVVTEAAPRRKKLTEPHPHLSLTDRFRIVGKPSSDLHVIVVGAGFAGLSTAYELQSVGYKVTVIEAQAEVGGRVESRRDVVPGKIMEGGAELIGLTHLAWWSYKHKFGLHLNPLPESGTSPVFRRGKRLDPAAADSLGREMDHAQSLIANAARLVNADEPWKTPGAKKLDRYSLVSGLNSIPMSHLCRQAFIELLQTDNGVVAGRQSWLGNLAMIKGGGLRKYWTETETHHCKGGNQQLAFKFKAKLPRLKLGIAVRGIEIDHTGVTVTLNRGKPVKGTDVVLAVPPPRWSDICFKPPLPNAYKVQLGRNVKYLLNVKSGIVMLENPIHVFGALRPALTPALPHASAVAI
jgi:monoamine oxidase